MIQLSDCDEVTPCYRNTGVIPVPRKISRRVSVPAFCNQQNTPVQHSRKLSCPTQKRLQEIREALEEELSDITEVTKDLFNDQSTCLKCSIQGKSEAVIKAKISKAKIVCEKVKTREPDIVKDIKRGSMKEKWGLSFVYRVDNGRLELVIKSVSMFSPAAKVGIKAGDILIEINGWKIEAMDHYQAALNLFMAAGFSVNLGWIQSSMACEGWGDIDGI